MILYLDSDDFTFCIHIIEEEKSERMVRKQHFGMRVSSKKERRDISNTRRLLIGKGRGIGSYFHRVSIRIVTKQMTSNILEFRVSGETTTLSWMRKTSKKSNERNAFGKVHVTFYVIGRV
ncbi:hypothetical protein CEXT_84591 [Caerostris extrusa]|uniref:Uncharacterized protein n=1 Tax=Caerostris extrusa TaxID=172846 RepID=A0AAV4NTW2_CAEEX|nr:hypothetical protein CEXT_84591 [Caerostris extrusa]